MYCRYRRIRTEPYFGRTMYMCDGRGSLIKLFAYGAIISREGRGSNKMASPQQVNYVAELNHYATRKDARFKDEYTESEGPQISRTYTCHITLLGRASTGIARSKKEAKILAAKNYLEQVLDVDKLVPSVSQSSSSGGSPGARNPSLPVALNHKGSLQELLQKHHCRVPEYSASKRGPSHNLTFTAKCTVCDRNGDIIKEVYGNAKTKKEAENDAAEKMRPFVEKMLSEELGLLPKSLTLPTSVEKSAPPVDPVEFDELIQSLMSLQCELPEFIVEKPDSDTMTEYLCLASTRPVDVERVSKVCHYDVASHPVVAHGMGETEDQAKCDALCNLMDNVTALGIS